MRRRVIPLYILIFAILLSGCIPNNPYREDQKEANIFYNSFSEPPKHLDPAKSYSSNEYTILGQIYEPPLQYHYLKRPYTLIPLVAERVPEPVYLDKKGNRLPKDAPVEKVHRAIYEIKIKRGILYAPHPAFARAEDGSPLYMNLKEEDLNDIYSPEDFPQKGTRELKADDFIYQIKRLADPTVASPILPILEKYILGMQEFSQAIREYVGRLKREGKPIPPVIDYSRFPFSGVEKVDDHTFRIILKRKYPQFVYWLAMPFFSPMPEEVVHFYSQPPLVERNITLDRFPVGTGPFRLKTFKPQLEMVLVKNENYHGETYPTEGEPSDREAGFLEDAGKPMPFLDEIVFKLEKEAIPRWNKFLQGYYDLSGITSDSFDQAVILTAEGRAELTGTMKEKGIRLITAVRPSTYYMGFNMLDDVVGGYDERKKKLRQAISIVLDYEEYIEIFNNGRGIPAMSPIPPGIFGYIEGREGINPFVYDWDEKKGKPVRKSIEEARRLMGEAGFPDGRDAATGKPLIITFDNAWTGVDAKPVINWFIKKFSLLGIQLENRTTDYNRFQEKMLKGNFQFFSWGWNADYPDPENFFFLLAGSNSKVKYHGENAANYENPEFDRLFRLMENMENGPERLKIIRRMIRILQEDSPWVWGYHPVSFTLAHSWVKNLKPNSMANNTMKYIRIDPKKRAELREKWNKPRLMPVVAFLLVVVIITVPAIIKVSRRLGLIR